MRSILPALLLAGCSGPPAIAPGKIVSNNPCIDAILAEIADPDQIGAVSSWSQAEASASAPVAWARRYPAIGASAEDLIAAKPSLALVGNLVASGNDAALDRAGVRRLAVGVPATIDENLQQVRTIATAIGQREKGEVLAARIAAATTPQGPTGKSAIIWLAGGFVPGAGTLQDELLTRAGYRNASATYGLNQWDWLPLEAVIRNPPDLIFMPRAATGETGRAIEMRQRLLARSGGRTEIRAFPERLLNCGGPTIIAAMAAFKGESL